MDDNFSTCKSAIIRCMMCGECGCGEGDDDGGGSVVFGGGRGDRQ